MHATFHYYFIMDMKMERIYLDQNIWLDIQLERYGKSLERVLGRINRNNVEIIYSPANIEEICNSYCSPNVSRKISVEEKDVFLDMLKKVTAEKEILPYSNSLEVLHSYNINDGPFIVLEDPEHCFNRVYQNYDSNTLAEIAQKYSTELSRNVDASVKGKLGRESFVSILERNSSANDLFLNLLSNKLIHKAAIDYLIKNNIKLHPWTNRVQNIVNESIRELRHNHDQKFMRMAQDIIETRHTVNITTRGFGICEAAIDAIMLTMIEFGYSSEKTPMSSLHDNSHAIYGAYSDYFISRDPRLMKKLASAYDFFGIQTKIIDGETEDWLIYLD